MDVELPHLRMRPATRPAEGEVLWNRDGEWWEFREPVRLLAAQHIGEVVDVVRAAEDHAVAGGWAYLAVAYGAAPAFDDRLPGETCGPYAVAALFSSAPIRWHEISHAEGPLTSANLDWDFADYGTAFRAVRSFLERGESYQVNLTYRGEFGGIPELWPFWTRVAAHSKPRYASFCRIGDLEIGSCSPELFFERTGQTLTCRPMKGTRPSTADPVQFAAHEKDRAENLMVVDMVRNDLGRIATPGSVEVARLFDVERHAELLQMTSTIRAHTSASLSEVFGALFPCASIVGAPKRRTMEIIRELEASPRGFYTGAIGLLEPGGDACFSVGIRTLVRQNGRLTFGVGSGVVWDSTEEDEWQECRHKQSFADPHDAPIALFETMRREADGTYHQRDRHLARMARSAACLGVPFDRDAAIEALRAARADAGIRRVKLSLPAGGADSRPIVFVSPIPHEIPPALVAGIARTPVTSTDPYLMHKTTRRGVYDRAIAEVAEDLGMDNGDVPTPRWEAILWNDRDEVTECANGNLVVELDGVLVTPPLSSGLLPGIQREVDLERGAIVERTLTLDDLKRATRAWRINSLSGWVPLEISWGARD